MFRRSTRGKSESYHGGESQRAKLSIRAKSVPNLSRGQVKGIMKYRTREASLHSKYGSSHHSENSESKESVDSSERRRTIQFGDLLVREYARTVGDNPSCSSGPPVT